MRIFEGSVDREEMAEGYGVACGDRLENWTRRTKRAVGDGGLGGRGGEAEDRIECVSWRGDDVGSGGGEDGGRLEGRESGESVAVHS